jgi:hypothetical protein
MGKPIALLVRQPSQTLLAQPWHSEVRQRWRRSGNVATAGTPKCGGKAAPAQHANSSREPVLRAGHGRRSLRQNDSRSFPKRFRSLRCALNCNSLGRSASLELWAISACIFAARLDAAGPSSAGEPRCPRLGRQALRGPEVRLAGKPRLGGIVGSDERQGVVGALTQSEGARFAFFGAGPSSRPQGPEQEPPPQRVVSSRPL